LIPFLFLQRHYILIALFVLSLLLCLLNLDEVELIAARARLPSAEERACALIPFYDLGSTALAWASSTLEPPESSSFT
jgi:hypothetical protein